MTTAEAKEAARQSKREGRIHVLRMRAKRCYDRAGVLREQASSRRDRAHYVKDDDVRKRIESVADGLDRRASAKETKGNEFEQKASSV